MFVPACGGCTALCREVCRVVHAHEPCGRACRAGATGVWCTYNVVSPDGTLSRDYPMDVQASQMMHDFAITKNYVIFYDAGLWRDGKAMVGGGGLPFAMHRKVPSRLGLLRKAAPEAGVFQWFDVEPFFAFHTINAWEEADGDTVCVAMCRCVHVC